jgi:type II secretory pathway component GspD/PulD (secretin)
MKLKKLIKFIAVLLLFCVLLSSVCAAAGDETNYTTHTVVVGESLSKIAKLYGVTIDAIAELNNITDFNLIKAGDVLKIPGAETEAVTTASETTASETTAAETTAAETTEPGTTDVTSYNSMINDMSTVISVNFKQTDVRDVLSAFAVNLGYNFIFKGAVTEVTLNLKDVTIGEALDFVMKLIDMTYITDGRTIIVGQKADLIKSFTEALQLTEFTLTYVSSDVLMSQITALDIAVTTSASGGNKYRFIAQGLPADLSKVRDLIAMIDKKENSMLGPMSVTSYFYTIELKYITAAELQKVLTSISLPVGVVLPLKPQTLYIYAGPEDYKSIINI